jgi:hypothetical protein
MKQYVKPALERVELMPNERLSNSSCQSKVIVCKPFVNTCENEPEHAYSYHQ